MPTRLGNALRAAEIRAGEPYGLDTVVAWPRLYPCSRTRSAPSSTASATRSTSTRASAPCSPPPRSSPPGCWPAHGWWLLVPAGCLVLTWLAYRAAVAAAIAYGESIRSAVDLHRFTLLEALHLPLPATPEEERALNATLSRFLLQGVPLDAAYEHRP